MSNLNEILKLETKVGIIFYETHISGENVVHTRKMIKWEIWDVIYINMIRSIDESIAF